MSMAIHDTLIVCARVALAVLALAMVYGTAAPLIHSNAWWIRMFDFPRVQITAVIALTLAGYVVLHLCVRWQPWEYALTAALALALIWQLVAIAPYTAMHPTQMRDGKASSNHNRVSILVYNVLSDNVRVNALLGLIRDTDPDLILLSEPNQWWLEQLADLEDDYPNTLHQPQENKYGMLLYSRLELVDPEIRFLIEPDIPSLRTRVRLRSGTLVTLYGMHPRPPGLKNTDDAPGDEGDGEREDSDLRDAELMVVAKEIKDLGHVPVIVAGDLNDVAWSHTTHLFQRVGGLLDPRVGRGLFNTFDTSNRLLRYPLDHVFASKHFFVIELRRLPHIGSDHFPLLVVLDYDPDAFVINDEPDPESGDVQEANEAIDTGRSNE